VGEGCGVPDGVLCREHHAAAKSASREGEGTARAAGGLGGTWVNVLGAAAAAAAGVRKCAATTERRSPRAASEKVEMPRSDEELECGWMKDLWLWGGGSAEKG
jgi:hypothetical protein